MEKNIIFEDNHLLILSKPINMPVQADSSHDLDLLTALKDFIKIRDNKPGNVYLGLVHRLDRPVGGVMVFAKTSKAASRLSFQIRKKQLQRNYLAVLYGSFSDTYSQGQLIDYLWKDRKNNQVYAVSASHEQSKKSVLHYQVLAQQDNLTLVKVQLLTGRSHQVRVQFQTAGFPLYGDQKYGGKIVEKHTQIALWSNEIQLVHPTLKERMTFQSLPPENYPWSLFKNIINNIKTLEAD